MNDHIVTHQVDTAASSTATPCAYSMFESFLPCRSSPTPIYLSAEQVNWFRHLGQCLLAFYKAQNELYIDSVAGRAPSWVSKYLDNGKPEHLVQLGRAKAFKRELPPIIRPDVLPVQGGYSICELDSVPGGFGLTAQIVDCYRQYGHQPIGDIAIEEGFVRAVTGTRRGADANIAIVVSDESQDYLAEMKWLSRKAQRLGYEVHVAHPRNLSYTEDGVSLKLGSRVISIGTVYRFMELFDYQNISKWDLLTYLAKGKRIHLTPAPKPYLEEKLWFALFHHPALQCYWRSMLGDGYLDLLKEVIPATWILDPTPVPPYAVIPGLTIEHAPAQSWETIKNASKRSRKMVIKPSGFSPIAWGSRGVVVGHDVSASEWSKTVDKALSAFPSTTYVLQEYKTPTRISLPIYADESGTVQRFVGRPRLSPYYFVEDGKARLSAILVTVCSSEKKKIHGMRDAVMTVCAE